MRKKMQIPRILKIENIKGHTVQCMFSNGESRLLDFQLIFKKWGVNPEDHEFPLLNETEFAKVELNNYTLSWPNIRIKVRGQDSEDLFLPYEVGADVLFELSSEITDTPKYKIGKLIRNARKKAGMTQEQLAARCGTTRFYISKIENDKADLEMSTFRKIVEAGLGKRLILSIE